MVKRVSSDTGLLCKRGPFWTIDLAALWTFIMREDEPNEKAIMFVEEAK
jgi:hypothetical protein